MECRFYKNKYPSVGEYVVVKNAKITDMGVYVKLVEYKNIEGLVIVGELSKKRVKSLESVYKLGKTDVYSILRVDEEKGYIDLSRKKAPQAEYNRAYKKYLLNKASHSVMLHTAKELNVDVEQLYQEFGWDMAEKHQSLYAFFIELEKNPKILDKPYVNKLIENIESDMFIAKYKVRMDIEVSNRHGINVVKKALGAHKQVSRDVSINLVKPPIYSLTLVSGDIDESIEILNKCAEKIKKAVEEEKGEYTVLFEPKVFGGKDFNDVDDED